jgi:hypothetical protein
MNQPHLDFWDFMNGLLTLLSKWFPTIMIGVVSSWISVQFQIHRKKINTMKQAWWVGLIAFALSMTVNYIASLRFEPWIANSMGVGTAIYGKDFLMWVFANWDGILHGILGVFKIKVKPRDEDGKN